MYTWEYGDKLKEIIVELGFDCLIVADNSLTVPMAYRPNENSIRYNMGRVQGIGMKRSYMLQDTFFCLAYHEIGHYIEIKNDPSLASNLQVKMNDLNFVYDREFQAFILGRNLIKDLRLLIIYDALNHERLSKLKPKAQ